MTMQVQERLRQSSILSGNARAIGLALDAAGHDGPSLLMRAGLRSKELRGSDARCPLVKMGRLWQIALEATQDPAFGVKLAKFYTHTTFHALGYGLTASSSLKEAFQRLQRFSHVVSDAVEYRFVRRANAYHLIIEPTVSVPAECVDALVGACLGMCRVLLGRDFSPVSIALRRREPDGIAFFQQQWRAPISFGCDQNQLVFDIPSVERHLPSGNPEIARQSDTISMHYLARIDQNSLETRIRKALTRRLPTSEPTQQELAEMLNLTTRTLQRRLVRNGTTFKKLLDDARHSLALLYLESPERSISEIADLLGFSCASSFTRACRRWTGISPQGWREGVS